MQILILKMRMKEKNVSLKETRPGIEIFIWDYQVFLNGFTIVKFCIF